MRSGPTHSGPAHSGIPVPALYPVRETATVLSAGDAAGQIRHHTEFVMQRLKTLGLVAHDARKADLLAWVRANAARIFPHALVCTGTTGKLIKEMFASEFPDKTPQMTILRSGPLGGDQQLGSFIVDGRLDVLFFLTDPMTTQPHDVDVKALVRLCTVYNIILACTLSTADFVISSPLFSGAYTPVEHDYSGYLRREAACHMK